MICENTLECFTEICKGKETNECPNTKPNCIMSSDKRKIISCTENKKTYQYENTSQNLVVSYVMDGGIIKNDRTVPQKTDKCDYMIMVNGNEVNAILVELKGVSVLKAIEQLDATLERHKKMWSKVSNVYARAIVASAVPKLKADPKYVKLNHKVKQYHGNIKVWEQKHMEKEAELGRT